MRKTIPAPKFRLQLLGFLLACLALFAVRPADAAAKPNFLVILADDLGWGDLSCQGAKDLRSPRLDQLAREGLRFENFHANCPVCSPTRASLLTGRYPDIAGVPGVIRTHADNSWGYLDPRAVTLPQLLKGAGYHTGIVGKWHLGLESPNTPNERGFDHFHGFLGDMMDDYHHHRRHDVNYMRRNGEVIDPEGHATDLFTGWACDYLRERARTPQPFFLYLAYNAPHTPIQPTPEWLARVKAREPGITDKRAKLVALIEHLDDGIGKVLATLQETGQAENTLVFFSSDNGGQLDVGANNGAWRDGKQSVYEGGLRISTIARWPGRVAAGSVSPHLGLTMDVYPTLAELAGVKFTHPVDGISLAPTLLDRPGQKSHEEVYFCRREGGTRYQGLTIEAVIRGEWKLLHNSPFEPVELYNLKNDPQEKNNLADRNRPVFNALSAVLRRHIQEGGRVPWQAPAR